MSKSGIVFGIFIILFGVIILFFGVPAKHQGFKNIDTSNLKYIVGGLVIMFGIYSVIKSTTNPEIEVKKMICPKCEKAYDQLVNKTFDCPDCGSTLENLDGFYERKSGK